MDTVGTDLLLTKKLHTDYTSSHSHPYWWPGSVWPQVVSSLATTCSAMDKFLSWTHHKDITKTFSNVFSWVKRCGFWLQFHRFVPLGSFDNVPALVQIMAWRRTSDKPLSQRTMALFYWRIYASLSPDELKLNRIWILSGTGNGMGSIYFFSEVTVTPCEVLFISFGDVRKLCLQYKTPLHS